MDERAGGEYQDFPSKNFCLSAENFRRGILYCCINFGYRKNLKKRGGGYQIFTSKSFCLTVPTKVSVGESFIVALISGYRKSLENRGGGVGSKFYGENLLSHSAENFRRGMLYGCINFGNRKSVEKGGSIKTFRRKFFVSLPTKISVGESFIVAIILGIEKVW